MNADTAAPTRLNADHLESRVLESLAAAPVGSVEELVARLDADVADVAGAVAALEALSVVRNDPERAGIYVVPPDSALRNEWGRLLDTLSADVDLLKQFADRSDQLRAAFERGISTSCGYEAEQLVGMPEIERCILDLHRTSTYSNLSVKLGVPTAWMLKEARPLDADVVRRGIDLRVTYPTSARKSKALRHYYSIPDVVGACRTAVVDGLPQFLVSDNKVAIIATSPTPDGEPRALKVTEPAVVRLIVAHFEQI